MAKQPPLGLADPVRRERFEQGRRELAPVAGEADVGRGQQGGARFGRDRGDHSGLDRSGEVLEARVGLDREIDAGGDRTSLQADLGAPGNAARGAGGSVAADCRARPLGGFLDRRRVDDRPDGDDEIGLVEPTRARVPSGERS